MNLSLKAPLSSKRMFVLCGLANFIASSAFQVAGVIMGLPFNIREIVEPLAIYTILLFFALIILQIVHLLRTSISRAPGWNLRRLAEFCFSKKTFTQVLEPTLSDMQKEHFEALAASRPWKARIVLVRGYCSFWSAVAAQLPISFARRIYEVWKTTKTGS